MSRLFRFVFSVSCLVVGVFWSLMAAVPDRVSASSTVMPAGYLDTIQDSIPYRLNLTRREASVMPVWANPSFDLGYRSQRIIELVLPDTIWHDSIPYPLVSLGDGAFEFCVNMTRIVLPKGLRSIGASAFWRCEKLVDIVIPDSVTTIGNNAFRECNSLRSLVVPPGVTVIPETFVCDCHNLTSLTLPAGITQVGNSAFYDCSSLTKLFCEAPTPPTVGSYVFARMDATRATIYVPYTSIDAYRAAEGWKSFSIQSDGRNFTWSVVDSVLIISGVGPVSFTSTSAPWVSLKTAVTDVVVEEGITQLPARSFANFTLLRTVSLPATLEKLGASCFNGCTSLESIASAAPTAPQAGSSCFKNVSTAIPVSVPEGAESSYRAAAEWKNFLCFALPTALQPTEPSVLPDGKYWHRGRIWIQSRGRRYIWR